MDLTEKQLLSEPIYDGKVVHLYKDSVRLPNGNTAIREVIRHQGAVCVVALDNEYNIYVVKQFRYPFADVITEIPAGKLEKGEEPLECAKRELLEETGLYAENFRYLGKIYSSPAFLDEVLHIYLATGLKKGTQNLDDDEFLDVEKVDLNEFVKQIIKGDIPDGKTQTAVLKAYYLVNETE